MLVTQRHVCDTARQQPKVAHSKLENALKSSSYLQMVYTAPKYFWSYVWISFETIQKPYSFYHEAKISEGALCH